MMLNIFPTKLIEQQNKIQTQTFYAKMLGGIVRIQNSESTIFLSK